MMNGSPLLTKIVAACAFLALPGVLPHAAAQGIDPEDPILSLGLSSLSDWSTASPFLDRARVMRPFFAFRPGAWESMSPDELAEGGHLGPDGYPLHVPKGMAGIRTIWAWDSPFGAEQRAGLYILTYDGTARVQLGGDVTVASTAPNRIVFRSRNGEPFWMDITGISPKDPIRAISLLRAEHVALAKAGAIFDPEWLSLVSQARELRFMNWMNTNHDPVANWDERPRPTDATYMMNGAPVEVMVRLANEAGIDPWFTMPHDADEAFLRSFATYVAENLDPRLKAHVEYSNETWNSLFGQFHWLRDQAIADWGADVADDWPAIFVYHTKKATEAALIWKDVFGAEADARLVTILGTQSGNKWLTDLQLRADAWAEREPQGFTPPAEVFQEVAGTLYFGGSEMADPSLREELAERASRSSSDAINWLYMETAQNRDLPASMPVIIENLADQKAIAAAYGLRFVAYEGGQHSHHSFGIENLSEEDALSFTEILSDFVRSPEMAALYSQIWDAWREIGDGPFMHYTEMGAPNRWGSWGLLSHPGDSTPRSRFLLERASAGGSWWNEGGGPQYLAGLIANGTEGNDALSGTPEEDYLLGAGGDDTFLASPGNDGINGGPGNDTFNLPGAPSEYVVAPEGQGHRITGPEGSDYLINVEKIGYGDGTFYLLR